MRKYTARRLLLAIPTLMLSTILIFFVLRLLPGDVAEYILGGGEAAGGGVAEKESVQKIREELGLNRPAHIQYLTWIWGAIRGDLGDSLVRRAPVRDELLYRLPITLQLGLMALGMGILFGITIGIISAIKQNSLLDLTLRFLTIFFLSAPAFWLGLIVLLVGIRAFAWSPPMGYNVIWAHPKANIQQLIFPAVIISLGTMAFLARMTRSVMLEVIREDYIRTARAKGLAEKTIIYRHALKNALIPIVTIIGNSLGNLVGGTVIMELVFSIPGMGLYFLESIQYRDYTAIQGFVLVIAVTFITLNLVVDLLYAWLDPRISYS